MLRLPSLIVCIYQNCRNNAGVAVLAKPHTSFSYYHENLPLPPLFYLGPHSTFTFCLLLSPSLWLIFWSFFMASTLLMSPGQLFCRMSPRRLYLIDLFLIWSRDQIEAVCLWQEHHRSDESFSASHLGAARSPCTSPLVMQTLVAGWRGCLLRFSPTELPLLPLELIIIWREMGQNWVNTSFLLKLSIDSSVHWWLLSAAGTAGAFAWWWFGALVVLYLFCLYELDLLCTDSYPSCSN